MNSQTTGHTTDATPAAQPSASGFSAYRDAVQEAICQVPPMWGLRDLVAVNPFHAYTKAPIEEVARTLLRRWNVDILPSFTWLQDAARREQLRVEDLREVLTEAGDVVAVDADELMAMLRRGDFSDSEVAGVSTIASLLDESADTTLRDRIVSEIAAVCASYFDRGVAAASTQGVDMGLYSWWKRYASASRVFVAEGLRGLHHDMAALPDDAEASIAAQFLKLGVRTYAATDLVSALLADIAGWAGYVRSLTWHDDEKRDALLTDLVAIRLAYEAALYERHPHGKAAAREMASRVIGARGHEAPYLRDSVRVAAMAALERRLVEDVRRQFKVPQSTPSRADVQLVMCIDVRSERFRRQLEQIVPQVKTSGFAGFFGMPVALSPVGEKDPAGPAPHLPVLLSPPYTFATEVEKSAAQKAGGQVQKVFSSLKKSAVSCFNYVETLGMAYVGPIVRDSLRLAPTAGSAKGKLPDIDLSSLTTEGGADLVAGMVKNLSLAAPFPRVLVLAGHEASTTNNPHEGGYHCGACAGHSGASNARIAARLYNDPAIREELASRGIVIPDDSVAVPAIHNTTTDALELLEKEGFDPSVSSILSDLRGALEAAQQATLNERMKSFGADVSCEAGEGSKREAVRRAADWAELRPEWGLANNALFIIARRERTSGVNLDGRAFLHDYDARLDADGSVLGAIMGGPVAVGSWINLQYYASSVAPERLGSGDKTLHNVSAGIGVVEGIDGDLAIGLAWQSLFDGEKLRHEPLRLQVIVEADEAHVRKVASSNPLMVELVNNSWIGMYALSPESGQMVKLQNL